MSAVGSPKRRGLRALATEAFPRLREDFSESPVAAGAKVFSRAQRCHYLPGGGYTRSPIPRRW